MIGNLLDAAERGDVNIVAHQANCFSLMGSGIAAEIATRYPEVALHDKADKRYPEQRLGGYSFCRTMGCFTVFNLYGQYHPGRNTDYSALQEALAGMVNVIERAGVKDHVIGFPLIGCGVGGDWDIVSKILKEELRDHEFLVYVLDERNIPR